MSASMEWVNNPERIIEMVEVLKILTNAAQESKFSLEDFAQALAFREFVDELNYVGICGHEAGESLKKVMTTLIVADEFAHYMKAGDTAVMEHGHRHYKADATGGDIIIYSDSNFGIDVTIDGEKYKAKSFEYNIPRKDQYGKHTRKNKPIRKHNPRGRYK